MSKDNLILFPKKSKPSIEMTEAEAKWMVAGSLLVVLTLALGINSTLFSQKLNPQFQSAQIADSSSGSRAPASINPIFRVSWEKKAFEVLENTKARDLANVGKKPSHFDQFAFGLLEGHYNIRKVDGLVSEIQFAENPESHPMALLKREAFLTKNLSLFSERAESVSPIHSEENEDRLIERYVLRDSSGQDVSIVQLLLDKDQKLLSMTVQ